MRFSYTSAVLAAAGSAAALPSPQNAPGSGPPAPLLPVSSFDTAKFARPLSLSEALAGVNATVTTIKEGFEDIKKMIPNMVFPDHALFPDHDHSMLDLDVKLKAGVKVDIGIRDLDEELERFEKRQSTCSNPRIRTEWDNYSNSDRQAYVSAIKCLQSRPASGQFSASKSRYEDLVALHQTLTPNVHGNAKFLLWHRYLLWTYEQMLRSECGFDRNLPWFDETKYAGKFAQSSIFSSQWFGSVNIGGRCVTDGQFANLAINIGPGTNNRRHCLARNNDDSKTINTGSAMVNACNQRGTYADMAACAEGGAHAWGHNGVGSVMQDVYASPADPTFWLHHAFIDRNFRIWQNQNPSVRTTTVGGVDSAGNPLTLDTKINVYGFRPDVRIRDVLNTQSTTLCYKYNY